MNRISTFLSRFLGLDFYTSDLDKYLKNYDDNHPQLSASQRYEIKKYVNIYTLRDKVLADNQQKSLWDKFLP